MQSPNQPGSGHELRQHTRIAVKWRFDLSLDGKVYTSGVTENVSCSGAGLLTDVALKNGARAHVRFSALIKGEMIRFDSIVSIKHVSLSGDVFRCGVCFLNIQDKWRLLIEDLVNESQRAKIAMRVA